jgi:hypothetical protein
MKLLSATLNHRLFLIFAALMLASVYTTKADRKFGITRSHADDSVPIISDAAGYYAWLPKWFVYHTDDFSFVYRIKERYPDSHFGDELNYQDRERPYNKYPVGTAVAMAPFFFAGGAIAAPCDEPLDGYSKPYRMMAIFSGIFYFFIGLIALALLLGEFGISRFVAVICMCMVAFGSNLGYYVYDLVGYSHVFSFAFVTLFLLFAKRWSKSGRSAHLVTMCALLGMVFLIRPTNVLVVLIVPFFFQSFSAFFESLAALFRRKSVLVTAVAVFGLPVFFQLYCHYAQTGEWSLNTYPYEHFDNWNSPKAGQVLFGFRKGLFIYAPALLLIFPGLIVMYRHNRQVSVGILIFLSLFTYVTAAWWCWWYGGCFGMRPYIDVTALFVLPAAFLFSRTRLGIQISAFIFLAAACTVQCIYDYQIRHAILHYDNMDADKFQTVFLHTAKRYEWALYGKSEHFPAERAKTAEKRILCTDCPVLLTIIARPSDSSFFFGGLLKGELSIDAPESNPSFIFKYYRRGKVVRENNYFLGWHIPSLGKRTEVRHEVNPGVRYGQFDSLLIVFDGHAGNTRLKSAEFVPARIAPRR